MTDILKIDSINRVIEAYFEKNTSVTIVPAKELMPAFIEAGIFTKDHKKGLPIRQILRELDRDKQLQLIPFVHPERKEKDTYWYFIPQNAAIPATPYKRESTQSRRETAALSRSLSDEAYVIDLCDTVLERKAERQKRFDFLLGDLHKDMKSRTKLPVDAYYESLNLVIEFQELQHSEPVAFFDKPEIKTVSGVSRDEQRKIYDQRRREELPKHEIKLIVIPHTIFSYDSQHKIIRNTAQDLEKVRDVIDNYKFNE
ncbi:MAG: hypothetical protein WCI92_11430 [Bacteroidota bacterium]